MRVELNLNSIYKTRLNRKNIKQVFSKSSDKFEKNPISFKSNAMFKDYKGCEFERPIKDYEKDTIYNPDGSLFNGVMTQSQDDKVLTAIFKDGLIQSSFDGSTYRKYEAVEIQDYDTFEFFELPRSEAVKIVEYNNKKNEISKKVKTFYPNGNLKHLYEDIKPQSSDEQYNGYTINAQSTDYYEDGKIAAISKYDDTILLSSSVFDKNGNLMRKIQRSDSYIIGDYDETIYSLKGTKIKEKIHAGIYRTETDETTQINQLVLIDPEITKLYDEEGNLSYIYKFTYENGYENLEVSDMKNNQKAKFINLAPVNDIKDDENRKPLEISYSLNQDMPERKFKLKNKPLNIDDEEFKQLKEFLYRISKIAQDEDIINEKDGIANYILKMNYLKELSI